jgi:tubby-related protein 1
MFYHIDEVEEIAMQFGRIDKDTFACDYRYPFSALQAFGIALSSFDSRFTRE